jgi:exopolyphosphatase / guanosine-5'-triphosphate,3'-diphosphate pyrophosphatase
MKKIKEPIAVIDVGAHFARLEIAQVNADGKSYETLESLTQVAPLGVDVFTRGKISSANTYLVGKILKDFSDVLREYGVKKLKAVATSAVREASNSELFIDRVYKISGIKLEELETPLMARIMFLAVRDVIGNSFKFSKKNSMICAIGTGETQVSFVQSGKLRSSEAARLGSLRLVEELQSPLNATQLKLSIRPFVESAAEGIIAQSTLDLNSGLVMGTGSSVRALLDFLPEDEKEIKKSKVKCLSRKQFDRIYEIVSELTPDEIAYKYNISDTLAQSIEPSCAILYHFLNSAQADKLIIPIISTRDAIIKDYIRELSDDDDPFLPYLYFCVKAIGEKYSYDAAHAEKVAEMTSFIFKKTKFLHDLDKGSEKLLKIAAYLHDVGMYINTRRHHKHSGYIIRNSQIAGITAKETNIIACIARYHRRALPKKIHEEYGELSSNNKVVVCTLAAILRIADALDFIDRLGIRDIKFDHKKKVMNIIVDDILDVVLENWALRNKADLFKDVFGYKVRISGQ